MSKLQRWTITFNSITGKAPEVVKNSLGLWVTYEDVKELEEDIEDYKQECVRCYEVAQRMDVDNPELKGAFTGPPSERIERQIKFLKEESERLREENKHLKGEYNETGFGEWET